MKARDLRKALSDSRRRVQEVKVETIDGLRTLNGYVPTAKQREAHDAPERYVLFGGAMGGGKSAWLVNEALFHCLRYPGARVYLARYELSSFKKTTLLTLLNFLPTELVKKHNRSEESIRFQNGSEIYYGGLGDDLRKIEKLKSMELSAYGIDQCEEVSESFFFMLNSRLRLNVPGVRFKAWLTANPSSSWVRARFIEKALEDHRFIPALPNENPYLPAGYEEELKKVLPEELLRAWVLGDWSVIADEHNVFDYNKVQEAMKRDAGRSSLVCYGVDVARFGGDETVIVKKAGNRITFEDVFVQRDLMETVAQIVRVVGSDRTVPIKIDSVGTGAGVYDRLKEQGYNAIEVIGSASPKKKAQFRNKRAENYWKLREFLPDLSLPQDEKLKAQMAAIRYRVLSDGLILIESKEELKRRGLASPDRLDAVALAVSDEKRVTAEEMRHLLPQTVVPEFRRRVKEAMGYEETVLPSPDDSPSAHEQRLARHGLTPEDEQEMLKRGIYIPGVTRRPEPDPKKVDARSPAEIMDDWFAEQGYRKARND
jgi:phage terminase large subunit